MNLNSAMELVQRNGDEHADCCHAYGEPGYSDPASGILFANWNGVPRHIKNGLERRGFELEWSDEWHVAYETGKAYRTSPDSYSWTPYYVWTDDGDVVGGDEIESGNEADWYVNEYLLNSYRHACVLKVDLASFGFRQLEERFETGFHPGQNDKPKEVLTRLNAQGFDVVFRIDAVGQFDVNWQAWIREAGEDE